MAYQVIARKYRPQKFDEVVGQRAVATILKNAIEADHVAHAYIFAGPRGVGKTTMARILGKALCCEKGPTADPCNECNACTAIQTGDDIDTLEIDGASNRGIDHVRKLIESAAYVPARSRYKLYIIDEAHMLTKEAFNALLKLLEEPPAHVKFVLVTTEPQNFPETIRSRCQRLDFRRISTNDMVDVLKKICRKEKIEISESAIDAIVRNSRGGLRDSQSLLEQLRSFSQDEITDADVNSVLGAVSRDAIFALVDAVSDRDAAEALGNLDTAVMAGVDVGQYLAQLAEHLRSLMLAKVCNENSPLIDETADALKQLKTQAENFELDTIIYAAQLLADTRHRVKNNPHSRIEAEMLLVKLCRLEDLTPLGDMLDRIERLERRLDGRGAPAVPQPGAGRQGVSAAQTRHGASYTDNVPPPQAVSEQPSAAPTLSSDLNESWPAVIGIISKKGTTGAMLAQGKFIGASDGVLRLGSSSETVRKRLENNKDKLEKAIEELVGNRWRLKFEPIEAVTAAGEAGELHDEPEQTAVPQNDSFVDQLVQAFNGIVMKSQR